MHKSKGLEWERVFLIDCVDGTTPYIRTGEKVNLEDERKAVLCGDDTAKKELYLYTFQDTRKEIKSVPLSEGNRAREQRMNIRRNIRINIGLRKESASRLFFNLGLYTIL